jgi:hypothetical protein
MPYIVYIGVTVAVFTVALGGWLLGFLAGYKAGWLDGISGN